MRKESDIAQLFKNIRGAIKKLEVSSNVYDALNEAKRKYYKYFQQIDDTNTKQIKGIKDLIATIKHYGGNVCGDSGLIKHEKDKDGGARADKVYKKIVRAKILGCAIIKRANAERY